MKESFNKQNQSLLARLEEYTLIQDHRRHGCRCRAYKDVFLSSILLISEYVNFLEMFEG